MDSKSEGFWLSLVSGFLLILNNEEINSEAQKSGPVEGQLRGASLKFGQRKNLC